MRPAYILLLLLLLLCACQSGADSWQQITQRGTLRVGLDPTYPPFENLDGDDLSGIDIDLMRALGEEIGLEIQFDFIGYDGLYDALLTGRVDVLASALIVDETRTKEFAYSQSYFNAGQVLVVAANSQVESMADVDAVAVELGAAGHVVATQEQQLRDLTILTYGTADEALNALLTGEAAAALTDSISAGLYLVSQPELTVADEAVTVEPYALVTRATDATLLRNLNAALQSAISNGDLDRIVSHHLNR